MALLGVRIATSLRSSQWQGFQQEVLCAVGRRGEGTLPYG